MLCFRLAFWFSWFVFTVSAASESVSIGTLNCYWFFKADAGKVASDQPHDRAEYNTKAGHLIGLLPAEAPLFVGFQEIGGGDDLAALAHSAGARYSRSYEPLFVRGHDTATGQERWRDSGHLSRLGRLPRASRVSELERELSKHLVVRLTNATASIDICVVHLRRAMGEGGVAKQREQCRALLRWAMRHLATNPKANVVILGDFNEGHPVARSKHSRCSLKRALQWSIRSACSRAGSALMPITTLTTGSSSPMRWHEG
jgi:hypothetical protein